MSRPMSPEAAAMPAGAASPPSISQQLRFRRLNKPSTIAEEVNGVKSPRRASSFMSDSSFDRNSLRSTTDDILRPRAAAEGEELHEDPDLWHSLPLFFALIPAVGGLVFKRGAVVLTDAILLVFVAIYLNWCLVTPWHWYHSAQTIKIASPSATEAVVDPVLNGHEAAAENTSSGLDGQDNAEEDTVSDGPQHDAALQELRMHELSALTLCFLGPLLGAYVLHIARGSLTHLTDDLVSSLHLTLFVLAAELRPLRYCLKMVQARSLHLQRIVREDPHALPQQNGHVTPGQERRLLELEEAMTGLKCPPADKVATAAAETMKKSQATMQSQIDALNRAVRRYEKRATAQTMQHEARMQDLEGRLRDALSLAAAAANYGQENGLLAKSLSWAYGMLLAPIKAMWAFASLPFRLASRYLVRVLLLLGLAQDSRKKRPSQQLKLKATRLQTKPPLKR